MKKVILCGYNLVGREVLKILYEKDFELFVYTHESPDFIPDLISYCEELSIPYSTDKISIKNLPFKPDIICSIYYRYIITADIIDISKGKIFNIHPSLLPKFRGCSSITWALINNEKGLYKKSINMPTNVSGRSCCFLIGYLLEIPSVLIK